MKTQNFSDEYLQALGHRIKIIRTFLKLDQRQMSKLMKTGQSQISKIESGRAAPTLHQLFTIKKIAGKDDYLNANLSWEWLVEGKGKGLIG
jgi:transcriptional regulator with XRE-family HTH domain